jgi:Tfp pilus assembly protein PilF
MPTAKDAVLKAMELQPELSRAHSVLAFIRWAYDWEWQEAGGEYKRAISLAPGDADTHLFHGAYLLQQERYEESILELRRAERLDPLSPLTLALEYTHTTLELEPGFPLAYILLGRLSQARSQP